MLSAEARVETERSSRYLARICRHISKIARARPQMRANAEWSDDHGVISFGRGRCTLRAEPSLLTLRAEAPTEENLRHIQQRVTDRLQRFGRREHLAVIWTPPQGVSEPLGETAERHNQGGHTHGGHTPAARHRPRRIRGPPFLTVLSCFP
jgi:hypothetical protein